MSLYDYQESKEIEVRGYTFYALVMACMRQADDDNLYHLTQAWPGVYDELKARYNAPGGLLPDEVAKTTP